MRTTRYLTATTVAALLIYGSAGLSWLSGITPSVVHASTSTPNPRVAPQYDTPHVYVSPDDFDSGLDFDYEGVWQFGTFGSGNIRSWTVASETGYGFPTVRLKPQFSAKVDLSSGDNPTSQTLGTFNPLFPKENYFGILATTGPGPINFIDVHPHCRNNISAQRDRVGRLDFSVAGKCRRRSLLGPGISDPARRQ